MCISPIILKNERARLTYSNSSTRSVPCGRCALCLKKRVNDWAFRLLNEIKISSSACFITLTYDNDNLPIDIFTSTYIDYDTGEIKEYTYPQAYLKKDDFQRFIKRLRKEVPKQPYINKKGKTSYRSNIKYYACGEYGNNNTKRPHYHAVIFNLPQKYLNDISHLENIWQNGIVHIGDCNVATIKYVCKYINKRLNKKNTTLPPEFALMSKNIGINWLNNNIINFYKRKLTYKATMQGGFQQSIPRYYKEKMFNEIELHKIKLEAITDQRTIFEEVHENNFINLNTWKQNVIRIHEKLEMLKRAKL